MEIYFESKEQSNARRQKDFLSLSGFERFNRFLWLSEKSFDFFGLNLKREKNNIFVLKRKRMQWHREIFKFIELANKHKLKMILIGGGAVNFHGYQRNSVDVDFWIDTKEENLNKLLLVFNEMGYEISEFPKEVKEQMQNISVKFSNEMDLEPNTRFSLNKTFDEAYNESEIVEKQGKQLLRWRVLSYDDLIESKIKAGRPKDLLDIQQLQKIKENKK